MSSVLLNVHFPAVKDKGDSGWKVWVGVRGAAEGEGEKEVNGDAGWHRWPPEGQAARLWEKAGCDEAPWMHGPDSVSP